MMSPQKAAQCKVPCKICHIELSFWSLSTSSFCVCFRLFVFFCENKYMIFNFGGGTNQEEKCEICLMFPASWLAGL